MCLVFLFEPNPIDGMTMDPLNLRRTLLSIPFGFLHDAPTVLNLSDWNLLKALVLFLTIGTCVFEATMIEAG